MKSTIFFVSDDSELVSKITSQLGSDPHVSLKVFGKTQWDQMIDDHEARQSLHMGVPTLSPGMGHENSNARVLHFVKTNGPTSGNVETMEQLEAKAIEAAIVQFKGNLTEAAKALGIGRATLYRKVKHYSIDPNQARRKKAA